MNSFISEMPGPAVDVNARAPAQRRADDHADGGNLVLGLQDREAVALASPARGGTSGRSS